MLSAEYRLTKKKDFQRIYKGGKTLNTALFRIKTHPNTGQNPRIGIIVSNKAVKKATKRNVVKRKIRAAIRELLPRFDAKYDIITIAQPDVASATYADILEDFTAAFTKIGFIQKHNDKNHNTQL